jgi:hypothetical protein
MSACCAHRLIFAAPLGPCVSNPVQHIEQHTHFFNATWAFLTISGTHRGKNIALSDLKGKWSVVYFYPGDFTSSCTIEANSFEKASPAIRYPFFFALFFAFK